MIKTPECVKRFNSAKARFLKGTLENFFQQELPKLVGPILREKLVDEIISLLEQMLPLKDHLKPGQIVWNAVDIRTRADSSHPRFVPVILTIIDEKDVEKLANGTPMSKIRNNAIARIQNEAYEQGSLLSMRDIGLISWRYDSAISNYRKQYEKQHNIILPNTGSLQDVGSCISHKAAIIRKIIVEKKDPLTVARETNHTMQAVDRYLKDFYRVQYCYNDNKNEDFTAKATGLNKFVIKEYFEILKNI